MVFEYPSDWIEIQDEEYGLSSMINMGDYSGYEELEILLADDEAEDASCILLAGSIPQDVQSLEMIKYNIENRYRYLEENPRPGMVLSDLRFEETAGDGGETLLFRYTMQEKSDVLHLYGFAMEHGDIIYMFAFVGVNV